MEIMKVKERKIYTRQMLTETHTAMLIIDYTDQTQL